MTTTTTNDTDWVTLEELLSSADQSVSPPRVPLRRTKALVVGVPLAALHGLWMIRRVVALVHVPRRSVASSSPEPVIMSARYETSKIIVAGAILFLAAAMWAIRHVLSLIQSIHGRGSEFDVIFFFAFILLTWQMTLSFMERPHRTTPEQQAELEKAYLVINVPCYNEDGPALKECIASMFRQTRKPDLIHVVDDGSTVDYTEVRSWFESEAPRHGVEARWDRQVNQGKRHAQGATISTTPQADFYITIDSDAILDEHSIEEGLKPFADPRVMSVAGLVLLSNYRKNLITWISELWFVVGQMVDRSAMSTMGSVLVNSGALAFYRGDLLRRHLDGYLHEEFFGRRIETSDDSMLTIYALTEGRAVQQPTAFAFTLMPEKYSHHRRQYLRWMRGAFIRSWWRFKYLPIGSYAYWTHFLGWMQVALSTITFGIFFIYAPVVIGPQVLPYFVIIPLLVGFGQGLRYFTIKRSDMSKRTQFAIFMLTPISTLYSFFVLRFIKFYAIATCLNTGWGTRQGVELTMEP